jgi:phage portal protein BeeE
MQHSKTFTLLVALLFLGGSAFAEMAKTYQVTGPILEVNAKTIVVQKGDERWEIARDEATKIKSEPKVGEKVTIHYRMTATSVENPSSVKKPSK